MFPVLPCHIDDRSKEECGSCMGAKKVEGLFLEFFVGEVRHDTGEETIQNNPKKLRDSPSEERTDDPHGPRLIGRRNQKPRCH